MRSRIANLHRWLSLLLILATIIAGSPSAAWAQNYYQYYTTVASDGTVDEQHASIVVTQQPDSSQNLSADQQITILHDNLGKMKTKVLKVEFYWSFLVGLINDAMGGREVKIALKQAVKRELKHLLADDFIQTGPDGKTINKAQYIDSIVGKQDPRIGGLSRIDECTYNGESAVINGRIRVSQGGGYLLFTDMLAKRDGRWRIISRHLSLAAKQQVQGSEAEADNSGPDKR